VPSKGVPPAPPEAAVKHGLAAVPSASAKFGVEGPIVKSPPHLGGDVKNIRRRLEAPEPDIAALIATLVAVGTTVSLVVSAFKTLGAFAIIVPILLAGGSGAVAILQYQNGRRGKKDPDLLQAQADADHLVLWQEEARVRVDREIETRFVEAERARRAQHEESKS
jgi:hypothetical protein